MTQNLIKTNLIALTSSNMNLLLFVITLISPITLYLISKYKLDGVICSIFFRQLITVNKISKNEFQNE